MAFMLQVKMAMGFENFNDVVIPNTVQTCQKQYDYPMVITLADRPYTIVQVNERWENLTGYKGADVVGKCSCGILQGANTSRKELKHLMSPVLFKRPSCGMLTNYTKNGRRFRSYITIYPLSTDSTISHYFGLTTFVQWIDADEPTKLQGKDLSDNKWSKGDYNLGFSKRPRDSTSCPSPSSQKSKHAKINDNSSSSCSVGTSINAVKVVTASNQDKQSLSSLTSSISSSSISRESGNRMDTNDASKEVNSVAVLVPFRTKASLSTATTNPSSLAGVQKVEFSVPLVLNCQEYSKPCKSEEKD
jgi:PAS domain S-box-containing protein